MNVKYPEVEVKLVGEDGNAFAILARVRAALSRHGVAPDETDAFVHEATQGDYDDLLKTVMRWVTVN